MDSEDKKVIEVTNPRNGEIEILAISSRMTMAIDKKIKKRQQLIEDAVESFEWIEKKRKSNPDIGEKLKEIGKIREKMNKGKYDSSIEDQQSFIRDCLDEISTIVESLPDKYAEKKVDYEEKSEEINLMSYSIIYRCFKCIGGVPEDYDSFEEFVDEIIETPDDLEFFIDFFLTHCTFYTRSHSEQKFKVVEK